MNPWINQYAIFKSPEEIKKKSRIKAVSLRNIEQQVISVACAQLQQGLESVFVPTSQVCEIIQTVGMAAYAHSLKEYPGNKVFLERVYNPPAITNLYVPFLLTGPAGTGKSQLMKAIERLLTKGLTIKTDPSHVFPLVGAKRVTVNQRRSINQLLLSLVESEISESGLKIKNSDIAALCPQVLYRSGCSLLMIDELQFMSQSSANTLLAQSLMALSYIGLPFMVNANYSVCHKLMNRKQEEKQRLLTNPIMMLPDVSGSADWLEVLREYQVVVQYCYSFNLVNHEEKLWSYCAGLKRVLIKLLVKSYELVRKKGVFLVTELDVEKAYLSLGFSVDRGDVELIISSGSAGPAGRLDLTPPFAIPLTMKEGYERGLKKARAIRVMEAAIDASLTLQERKALNSIKEQDSIESRNPIPIKQKVNRKSKPSPDILLENFTKFIDKKK